MALWDELVDAVLTKLEARKHLFNTRLITLAPQPTVPQTFDGPGPWDRASIEICTDRASLQQWLTISQYPCMITLTILRTIYTRIAWSRGSS